MRHGEGWPKRKHGLSRLFAHAIKSRGKQEPGDFGTRLTGIEAGSWKRVTSTREFLVGRHITAPNVRALALERLQQSPWCSYAADLLPANYQEGDFWMLERCLAFDMEDDSLHRLGFAVKRVIGEHPGQEAIPTLLLLYERGPCSFCRKGVVKSLIGLSGLPEWMRAECGHDAEPDIRAMVARGAVSDTD